jgi:hypothetical protein
MSAPFIQIEYGKKSQIRQSNRGKLYNTGSGLLGREEKNPIAKTVMVVIVMQTLKQKSAIFSRQS